MVYHNLDCNPHLHYHNLHYTQGSHQIHLAHHLLQFHLNQFRHFQLTTMQAYLYYQFHPMDSHHMHLALNHHLHRQSHQILHKHQHHHKHYRHQHHYLQLHLFHLFHQNTFHKYHLHKYTSLPYALQLLHHNYMLYYPYNLLYNINKVKRHVQQHQHRNSQQRSPYNQYHLH